MRRPLTVATLAFCLALPAAAYAGDGFVFKAPPTLDILMGSPPTPPWTEPACDLTATDASRPLLLAQQGCCSSHNGVCGCSSAGRTQCCDGTQSPTCTCTPTTPPPPTHTLTITSGPAGTPEPVASGGTVQLSVTAVDSLGHALDYHWSVSTCLTLPSMGSFDNASSRTPIWTAPTNTLGIQGACSIDVAVTDGQGLSRSGFVTQHISPAPPPPPHTLSITAGPSGSPNPVASGASVNISVTAVDSLGHNLSYAWTAACSPLPSNGTFSNAASRTPIWTAPANETTAQQTCVLRATVNDGNGLSQTGTFTQGVLAVPAPPPVPPAVPSLTVVATGCTTCHSGQVVSYRIDFTNPGAAFDAELRGGARFPDGSILMLVNQTVTIPAGASSMTLVPSQALPAGLPTIDLLIETGILEPGLAVTLARHNATLHLLP